jgi:hypothetical protein
MEKKNIKKYVVSGLLAAILLAGPALGYHGTNAEKVENVSSTLTFKEVITDLSKYPKMTSIDQEENLDFKTRCINNLNVYFGIVEEVVNQRYTTKPTKTKNEDGTVTYSAPVNYILTTDENGELICQKDVVCVEESYGYKVTWGPNNQNEKVFKFKRQGK